MEEMEEKTLHNMDIPMGRPDETMNITLEVTDIDDTMNMTDNTEATMMIMAEKMDSTMDTSEEKADDSVNPLEEKCESAVNMSEDQMDCTANTFEEKPQCTVFEIEVKIDNTENPIEKKPTVSSAEKKKDGKRSYQTCCVHACPSTTIKNPTLTFFSLPTEENRRNEWLRRIHREDLKVKTAAHGRVCELHFEQECMLISPNRKVLKKNAIPKLQLPKIPGKSSKNKKTQTIIERTETFIQCSMNESLKKKFKDAKVQCTRRLKTDKVANDPKTFYRLSDKFLTKNLASIVKEQTKLKLHCSGNRYSKDYKHFCLNLYYSCPQAYELFDNTLCLPSSTARKRLMQLITVNIESRLTDVLKAKIDTMNVMEKNCSLVLHEMYLKQNLHHDPKQDKIHGFHEMNGIQSPEPAKTALMAIVQGIFEDYKLPVDYALLAEGTTNQCVIEWIDKLIEKLFQLGLNVRNLVLDMDCTFSSNIRPTNVSSDSPYFFVGNRKIYYIFDMSNNIRMMRNKLMNYDFHFGYYIAKWSHIKQFYEKDKAKPLRLAKKLTDSHIKPNNYERKQDRLALQVFSETVAAGISTYRDFGALDPSAEGTIKLLTMINDLYDLMNSNTATGNTKYQKPFCGDQFQVSFIYEMLNLFSSLKLAHPKHGKPPSSTLKFIDGFQITLKSLLLLYDDLKLEGYTNIYTRRLSLQCLDTFFGRIRTQKGLNSTSFQLALSFRRVLFINALKPSKEGNCTSEVIKMLLEGIEDEELENEQENTSLAVLSQEQKDISLHVTMPISNSDYSSLVLPQKNSVIYIAGYLLKKCYDQHKDCVLLKAFLIKSEDSAQNYGQDSRFLRYQDYCRENGKALPAIPQDDFVQFVELMEVRFSNFFKKEYIEASLKSLLKEVQDLNFIKPCDCFPVIYCKTLYFRMRLFHTLKDNNSAFKQHAKRRKYFTVYNLN